MAQRWQLFFDRNNRVLLTNKGSNAAATLPRVLHNETPTIELMVLDLDNTKGGLAPYSNVDPSGSTATIEIYAPNGTTLLAQATLATADTLNSIIKGTLILDTEPMRTAIEAASPLQCFLCLNVVDSTGLSGLVRTIMIDKNLTTTGVPAPLPGAVYLTAAEIAGIYLKRYNDSGVTVTFVNGGYTRTMGVTSDGSPQDDLGST